MIGRRDFMKMKAQHKRGVYKKDIAARLGVSPRTIARALERGAEPPGKRPAARGSILDPYKEFVNNELASGVWNAQVIYLKLKDVGYEGGYTLVKRYVSPRRPLAPGKATVRFETLPGVQMQSDWGKHPVMIAGEPAVVHFCVNLLGYSRRFHFFVTDCEDANNTAEAQQLAFRWFGGATREVLVDNQKVAVAEHEVKEGKTEKLIFNPTWLAFLAHYGSSGKACRPYRAKTKGKVERTVGYVKRHFFALHPEAESLADYNNRAEAWLKEVADRRVHGTTGRVVAEMFKEEKDKLLTLPPVGFDTSYAEWRIVSWDSMVEVRGNRYSVPDSLLGKKVQVHIGIDGSLRVLDGDSVVARHTLRSLDLGWSVVPEHHENLWAAALCVQKRPLSVYEEVSV